MTLSEWLTATNTTAADLGRACGRSRSTITNIVKGRTRASAELALAIERQTAGAVSRYDVAPHIYPAPNLGKAA